MQNKQNSWREEADDLGKMMPRKQQGEESLQNRTRHFNSVSLFSVAELCGYRESPLSSGVQIPTVVK